MSARERWLLVAATLVASCATPVVGPDGGVDAAPVESGLDAAADVVDSGPCTPGQTRCSDSLIGVETCDTGGAWGNPVACAGQTCVAGACAGVCAPGDTQCAGADLQSCDATGNFATTQTCPVACCAGACVDTNSDPSNCGACGTTCTAGWACGKSFTAFTGTQSSNWTANGNATYDSTNNAAKLSDLVTYQAGTWVYDHPLYVDDVTVQFDFYVGGGTGADGMAVMFETDGTTALGTAGGGLAIAGLTGFGVELDEYDNATCLDASANHVAIDSLTACSAGPPTSLVENDSPGFTISDATWHTMNVHVANGAFTVTVGNATEFSSYTPSGWANGNYYLAFGGATGGATNVHSVRNVTVSFAAAHCY
jgi:hypothetical protein